LKIVRCPGAIHIQQPTRSRGTDRHGADLVAQLMEPALPFFLVGILDRRPGIVAHAVSWVRPAECSRAN